MTATRNTYDIGIDGERTAIEYLIQCKKHLIISHRFKTKYGEIDIISSTYDPDNDDQIKRERLSHNQNIDHNHQHMHSNDSHAITASCPTHSTAKHSKHNTLIFNEIKYRSSHHDLADIEHIVPRKQVARLHDAALYFLSQHAGAYETYLCRFDLIIIVNNAVYKHIENAWMDMM